MVATRFNQDLSIGSRHKIVAAEAQRIANERQQAVTIRLRNFGAELLVGVVTGPYTLTYLPER